MNSVVVFRSVLLGSFVFLGFQTSTSNAQSLATDFAVFGGSDVVMETYSVVLGDVYSGGDLHLEFGYGIQEPDINMGDMYAYEDFLLGSLSDVNGDVYTNGTITVEGSGSINGETFSGPGTVEHVPVPFPTVFFAGDNDVVLTDGQTLPPGIYGDISQASSFSTLVLLSGDYYLRSLSTQTGAEWNLLITDGPINIFVEQDVNLGTGMDVRVNGVLVGTAGDVSIKPLASKVLFETHGNFSIPSGFLSYFFGTIFVPFGSVNVDTQNFYGSIIAANQVHAEAYVEHYPSDYLLKNSVALEIVPSSFNVFRGIQIGGTLDDVTESDDVDLRFNPGLTLSSIEPPVSIIFSGTFPIVPNSASVTAEAGANTVGLTQTIEMFNWNSFQFEIVDSRVASFNSDSTVSVDISSELANYLQAGTNNVGTRLSWIASGPIFLFPWEIGIDHVSWMVE